MRPILRRQPQDSQANLPERLHVDAVWQRQLRRACLEEPAAALVLMSVANHHEGRHSHVDDVPVEACRRGD